MGREVVGCLFETSGSLREKTGGSIGACKLLGMSRTSDSPMTVEIC